MKEQTRKNIEARIKEFDLCSLLNLLRSIGYSREHIYFISNNTPVSHSNLCQEIHFSDHQVAITINLGLLSSGFAFPSFIQQLIDRELINGKLFLRFLGFFDHHLISRFIEMTMPETSDSFFLNWKETQIQYLSLLGFESVSTLWFLMKTCFPDLVIDIKKNPQTVRLHTSSLILGRDSLGPNSYLGNRFKQSLSSFKVIFTTDHEMSDLETPWPVEINKRLTDLVFPLLRKTDLHLSIVLHIKKKANYLTLGPKSHLGFDRIWKASHPFQLLIFYGLIRDSKKNSYI